MAPAAKPTVPRKRNRKRKRRADFSSSSSSSSSSSDSDSGDDQAGVATITRKVTTTQQKPESDDSDPSSSSAETSSEDSDSEEDTRKGPEVGSKATEGPTLPTDAPKRARSTSPPPPSTAIPSFLGPRDPGENPETTVQREQELKDKFRKFWMSAVADGFKDDLEEIRKEPNLTTSKLSLLIESLASGADLFSSTDKDGVNEMKMLVG
ncbi:hypothetical protein L218DRAFT_972829 [Marasmius fiardii PR-910]|nr:hypothetical protein L218DRAFT_972829 [Marasmius fiardii PR-910]